MLELTDIVSIVALVCSIVGTTVAILNLRKRPKVRVFLLFVLFISVVGILWISVNGLSAANLRHVKELTQKAREDARKAKEAQRKEEDEKIYGEALAEQNALLEAKKTILGAWACSAGGKIIFNSGDTASNELFSNVYTYRFMNSRELELTAGFGLGPTYTVEVNLSGSDQNLRWHGVVCHRPSK
ncbi:MAG: hypothetical protein WA738_22120 [Candidatus Angelobacter sp.]